MRAHRWRDWFFAVLLHAPVLAPLIAHYSPGEGDPRIPTGFMQYDQPYYMANARQYLDGASNGPLYALPFSADPGSEPIHFQPQTILLAAVWWITNMDPGLLFSLFGVVFGILCVVMTLAVLREVLPEQLHSRWIELLFIWGGGVLCVGGVAYGLLYGEGLEGSWIRAFRFDPANGYWFMNLGRNLIFPLEAYYHFLFFSIILLVIRGRFAGAFAVTVILALSHPFTGIATVAMLTLWSLLSRRSTSSQRAPWWFVGCNALLLGLILFQHAVLLPRDPEHAILVAQWTRPWIVEPISTIGAYALVAALALIRILRPGGFPLRGSHSSMLLVVWVVVWLALENHDLFMTAIQPAHFTRGYAWAGLFLLGAPVLARWFAQLRSSTWRWPVLGLATALFLTDNAVWLGKRTVEFHNGAGEAINLTPELKEVLDRLAKIPSGNSLVVADDPMVAYLALVYTPHRTYYSHRSNTPWADQRHRSLNDFFDGRITDPLLSGELIVVHYKSAHEFVFARNAKVLFSNSSYEVFALQKDSGRDAPE
ncbi:MAG: hypothetical protein IPP83_18660 [Flavobacteriales bacterium]|nr:hypothetical protein [Flavobacteriales bacterium]